MSLMRQLWLAVILSAIVAFVGSLSLSVWSAQSYLSQQLEQKNSDIANSLALSLTHIERGQHMIDLHVAALFDTGYYQSISVTDPLGRVISKRTMKHADIEVPQWFVNFLHIESKPAIAEIGSSRQKYGAVEVISSGQFAYRILWNEAVKLFAWFGLISLIVGMLSMYVLRSIGKSLDMVVDQASALGERRLMTIAEPRISELKSLARAMNGMVERVWKLFNEEAGRIDELRRRVNHDQLTGLPNRDYFMAHLKAHLAATESAQCGVMALIRLSDLNQLNSALGRQETDRLLCSISKTAHDFSQKYEDALSGRIKSGEIAIMLPGECDAHAVSDQLMNALNAQLVEKWSSLSEIFHLGVVRFERSSNIVDILSKVDQALAIADGQGANSSCALEMNQIGNIMPGEQWHALITHAIESGDLRLAMYPVLDKQGKLLHQEVMVRLRTDQGSGLIMAGEFMPIASHFSLTPLIDLEVLRMVLKQMASSNEQLAINISAASIANWTFRSELSKLLRESRGVCARLWIEVSEYGAFKHFDAFKDICFALKALGCHVGVEQFGQRLSEIKKITELGLDYVKLNSSLVEGIAENAGNQEFIRRFCEVVHTVGIRVVAVGVHTESEWSTMRSLGVDAVTGPVIINQKATH